MTTATTDLLDEYVLSAQLLTDGQPIRCVAAAVPATASPAMATPSGPSLELLCGSEGGVVSRISFEGEGAVAGGAQKRLDIQPGGPGTRHPHQITAILSSSACACANGGTSTSTSTSDTTLYATGCRDGKIRVMNGQSHALKFTLEGHSKAVTSLSWVSPPAAAAGGRPWLISGSWDGTAKIWDLAPNGAAAPACLGTLPGHENTVSVAGLPPAPDGVRRAVTASAGVAEGNVIRGHAVRVWRLEPSPDNPGGVRRVAPRLTGRVADDHAGPIRDVAYDPVGDLVYTCSNDGTVRARSAADGIPRSTLAFPGTDPPMLLSLCVVGDIGSRALVAGAEDGRVAVWDLAGRRETQILAHPGCIWKVAPLRPAATAVSSADFITACNDGHLRIFTRSAARAAPAAEVTAFTASAREAAAARSTGPSPAEVAALPRWETSAGTPGKAEGQVQMFQREGRAIAAQWSAASRTWIEVGEVTGTNYNAGTLDGRRYDHVLPIELDVPGGGVRELKIGYNNGENPFVTAQAFIDEHMLDQGYLAQIADYIQQRTGEGGGGPTLGGGSGAGFGVTGSSTPAPMDAVPTYDHLPMQGYRIFDAGADQRGLAKVLAKVREFNAAAPPAAVLSPVEAGAVLDALASTLAATSRYHASVVADAALTVLRKMVAGWDAKHIFPALDLARLAVLHPDAAQATQRGFWESVLGAALDACLGLGDGAAKEVAVPLLTMRLIANSYKGGNGSAGAAGALVDRILECAIACASSNNKNVRLSVATVVLNTSSYMYASSAPVSSASAVGVLDAVGAIADCGKYDTESRMRALVALGTVLLVPGTCGAETRSIATDRSLGVLAGRVAHGHGDLAAAVAKEISKIVL